MDSAEAQTADARVDQSPCRVCNLFDCPIEEDILKAEARDQSRYRKIFQLHRGDGISSVHTDKHRIWVVVSGFVAQSTILSDGRRQITGLHSAGAVICPVAGLEGTQNLVEALCDSDVCEVDLQGLIKGDLISEKMIANLFRVAHGQLETAAINRVMLGRLDGMERIYQFLSEVTRRLGRVARGGYKVHLPMSREDIADYLGLNAETVSRLFSKVRKKGYVTFLSPTDFVVHDLEKLEQNTPISNTSASDARLRELRPDWTRVDAGASGPEQSAEPAAS